MCSRHISVNVLFCTDIFLYYCISVDVYISIFLPRYPRAHTRALTNVHSSIRVHVKALFVERKEVNKSEPGPSTVQNSASDARVLRIAAKVIVFIQFHKCLDTKPTKRRRKIEKVGRNLYICCEKGYYYDYNQEGSINHSVAFPKSRKEL
jgi:hypothetical protein